VDYKLNQTSLPCRNAIVAEVGDFFGRTCFRPESPNGTLTLIKRLGKHYAVTAGHVSALTFPDARGHFASRCLSFKVGKTIINLAQIAAGGLEHQGRRAIDISPSAPIDLSIFALSGFAEHLLFQVAEKTPIDLDAWVTPPWSRISHCLAFGYPTEHKSLVDKDTHTEFRQTMISPLVQVGSLREGSDTFSLSDRLERSCDYAFSGMSGGPVYAIDGAPDLVTDSGLFPIGLIFEGHPSSHKRSEVAADSFLDDRDILFRCLSLSPERFDEWLGSEPLVPKDWPVFLR
jgi:hypothetical protein